MGSANDCSVTLINVFTVDPANQKRLIELLTEATKRSVHDSGQRLQATV